MNHNDDLSPQQKKAALARFPDPSPDLTNRLFFAARNGAISHLLRQLEQHFAAHGLVVRAQWSESSFNSTHIELAMKVRAADYFRTLRIKRTKETVSDDDAPSGCFYELDTVQVGGYLPHRTPKLVETWDAVLADPNFKTLAARLVNGANYPFAYTSHSSF